MQNNRLFACAAGALLAATALSGAASAQPVVTSQTSRIGHVGMPLYLRVPVGSRAEAAALKAEQNAVLSAQQTSVAKNAGKKR